MMESLLNLEGEACLKVDGSRSQTPLRLPKVEQGDVVGDAGWVEVQIVEEVEEVGADLNLRVFTQARDPRQTECLRQACVEISVAWTGEGITSDSWRLRNGSGGWKFPPQGKRRLQEVWLVWTGLRKVFVHSISHERPGFECSVAGILSCPAEIGGGPQLGVATAREVELSAWNVVDGCPWESGMNVQASTDRPASGHFFNPGVVAVEEDWLP